MNHKILSRSTAALALALLAGCGGGGGGTSAGGSPPPGSSSGGTPQPPGFTVGSGGTAGKGIITGATVDALEVTATGLVSRGQSTTGGDGGFNVQLSRYTGGPILYRLRGGAGAQMKCDVRAGCVSAAGTPVAFGSFFALADSFVMEGISPGVAQAATLTACLSPLTHLAASRARELAGGVYENINTDQAKRALIELRLLTGGIDVGRSCVIDLTDPAQVAGASPELLAHAFYAAAALASTPDGNPTNALARLTQAFQGGVIAATDTDPARLSLAELANAAANEATAGAIPLPDSIQLLQMTAEQAAGTGNQVRPCSSEPCGGTPAQVSASEKARAVFGELRSLFRNGERELTDPAAAFAEQIEAAAMAASPSAQQLGQGLGSGAQQAVEFYFSNNMTAGSETLDSTDSSGTARTATVTIANNADGSDTLTLRGQVQDAVLDASLTLPHATGEAGTLNVRLLGTVQSAGASGVRLALDEVALTLVSIINSEGDGVPDELTLRGAATLSEFGVADPVSVRGTVEASILRCTSCSSDTLALNYNPRLFALGGRVANAANAVATSLRFDVDAASARSFNNTLPYSASNFVKGSISVGSQVQFAGTAAYNAVVALNSTGFDSVRKEAVGNFTVKLARADKLYNLVVPLSIPTEMTAETLRQRTASIQISTANGVNIAIDNLPLDDSKPITGSVSVDGIEAASIAEADSGAVIVRYKDGVIESLY